MLLTPNVGQGEQPNDNVMAVPCASRHPELADGSAGSILLCKPCEKEGGHASLSETKLIGWATGTAGHCVRFPSVGAPSHSRRVSRLWPVSRTEHCLITAGCPRGLPATCCNLQGVFHHGIGYFSEHLLSAHLGLKLLLLRERRLKLKQALHRHACISCGLASALSGPAADAGECLGFPPKCRPALAVQPKRMVAFFHSSGPAAAGSIAARTVSLGVPYVCAHDKRSPRRSSDRKAIEHVDR